MANNRNAARVPKPNSQDRQLSLSLLLGTLSGLADDTTQLPSPLDLFATELEVALLQALGVDRDGS